MTVFPLYKVSHYSNPNRSNLTVQMHIFMEGTLNSDVVLKDLFRPVFFVSV